MIYPILTESKKPYAFATRVTILVLIDARDEIISLTVLLKDDFKVEFTVGTSDDPNFGGYLIAPTGSRVPLVLEFPYSTQDRKSVSTIKYFIATIQHDDFLHPLGVKQGYIDNGLRDTDVNE